MYKRKKRRDPSAPLKPHTDIRKKKWRTPGPQAYQSEKSREYLEAKEEFTIGVRHVRKKKAVKGKRKKKKKKIHSKRKVKATEIIHKSSSSNFKFSRSERFPSSLAVEWLGPGAYSNNDGTIGSSRSKKMTFSKSKRANLVKTDTPGPKKYVKPFGQSTKGGGFGKSSTGRNIQKKKISLKQMIEYRKEAAKILLGSNSRASKKDDLPMRPQTTSSYEGSRSHCFANLTVQKVRSKSVSFTNQEKQYKEMLEALHKAKFQKFEKRIKKKEKSVNCFGTSDRFENHFSSVSLQLYPKPVSETMQKSYSFGNAPRSPPLRREKRHSNDEERPKTSGVISSLGYQPLSTLQSCPTTKFATTERDARPLTADVPGPGSYRPSLPRNLRAPIYHDTNEERTFFRPHTADVPGPKYEIFDEMASTQKKGVAKFGKSAKDHSYIQFNKHVPPPKYDAAVSSLGEQFTSDKMTLQMYSFSKSSRLPDLVFKNKSTEPKYTIPSIFDKQVESQILKPSVLKFGTSQRFEML